MSNTPYRVLCITVRADFGGGPEHLYQLLANLPGDISAFAACPPEYPYCERYQALLGPDCVTLVPHRAFCLGALWRLRGFCREKGITVIHSHGKGAGLYGRLLALLTGLPCVHTFHGVHVGSYSPLKKRVYCLYERLMSRLTRWGIAVSHGERAQILELGLMPEERLRCILNGVAVPDAAVPPPQGPPYSVVSISRFDYQKNSLFVLDILEALRRAGRCEDIRFVLVGDGDDRQTLLASAAARGFGAQVRAEGATERPHVAFSGALCSLSTSRWEGLPLAVLEAQAHGLPVVVSDVVGNQDAVCDGQTGMLYPEGDADAAAAALLRLADDPALRARLAEAARASILARHTVQHMAAQTAELLRESAGRHL